MNLYIFSVTLIKGVWLISPRKSVCARDQMMSQIKNDTLSKSWLEKVSYLYSSTSN